MRLGIKNRAANKRSRDRSELLKSKLGDRSIVLIGLMGAGKTSIGQLLAKRLALPFVDADHEIEAAAGMSVSDIFAEHGEAYFRDGERKVIERLLKSGPQVLATGGGAFMNEQTRKAIGEHGVTVWLKADLNILMERVSRRDTRPLLQNSDPRDVMKKLLDDRYPIYGCSDVVVNSRNVKKTVIVNEAVKNLFDFLCTGARTDGKKVTRTRKQRRRGKGGEKKNDD